MSVLRISVEPVAAPADDVRELVDELERELSMHYVAEQRHGLNVEALFQPHIRFFVARVDGKPAGCGGIAFFEGFAELKRMYVRPRLRGSGVADAIIAELERQAVQRGTAVLRLETGTAQLAAIRFYERHGFAACDAFGPYASMTPHAVATSLFMEKRLF
jgi:GNAT superfamily N-acetyltransferase